MAQVGEVTGSPMDITWSQVTIEGEEELFTHTVEVASFEAAYSVGESSGTLTPGTYRVEATLAGESLSTQFDVEAAEETGATGQGATSGPPSSGDSGAVATPASDVIQQQEEAGVLIFARYAPVDPDAPIISVEFFGYALGGGRLEGKATMGGSTRTVSYPLPPDGTSVSKWLDFNPCAHPGGSDLPGTKATFEAAVYKGNEFFASETQFTTLGPDTTKPGITINSQPPAGSRVEPGEEILLDATAQEIRSGASWQAGLQTFQLTATPGGQVGEPQQARSRLPQPCDRKQWSLATQETYEVPADAPPIIEICGIAEDFAGNVQTTCNKYYTGEVWKGEIHATNDVLVPGACDFTWDGPVTFTVSADGAVVGTADVMGSGCGAIGASYPVEGRATPDGFVLTSPAYFMQEVTLTRTGNQATGPTTYDDQYNHVVGQIEVTCVTCEEAVG